MIDQEEIRLLGQPVKITVPGKTGQYYISPYTCGKFPILYGGNVHYGYAMGDVYDWHTSVQNIYIEIDKKLYELCNWDCFDYPITDYLEPAQETVTFDKVRKIILFLYDKLNTLEDRMMME